MNPFKSIIAGIAIFSTAVSALAEPSTDATIVRITGSTAFRAAAHTAIVNSFDSLPVAGYAGGNLSGAGRSFFYGQILGEPVIISCSWSGSVGGVQVVAGNLPVNFLNDNLADSTQSALAAATVGAGGGTQISSSGTFGANSKIPDIAMSDTFQAATPFKTPTLADVPVGVVGFKWITNRGANSVTVTGTTTAGTATLGVSSTVGLAVGMTAKSSNLQPVTQAKLTIQSIDVPNSTVTLTGTPTAISAITAGVNASTTFASPSPITNITTQMAQALYRNGKANLRSFTGNPADSATTVYAMGRDPDSGTRLTAFAESGVGVNTTVTQYQPTASGGTISALTPYAPQTVNGILFTEGNGGESSGGTLAGFFGNTTASVLDTKLSTSGSALLVGYVSSGDAATGINAGGSELTYNGVAYSDTAIKEGFYTFWCYEHVMYPATWNTAVSGSIEAKKKAFVDTFIPKVLLAAPIKLSEMNCTRTVDGGIVTHNP